MAIYKFVRHAQKDYPEDNIKKGEPYKWMQTSYGGKSRFPVEEASEEEGNIRQPAQAKHQVNEYPA